jgi:nanoRNase/pAp phosphatase (c-di-AMP/oligoRNAs hydrolase)
MKSKGMVIVGNGCAFLQMVVMLERREILPITNNNADFLTLKNLETPVQKMDFQDSQIREWIQEYPVIVISSTTQVQQILKAVNACVSSEQVILVIRRPKLKKQFEHPHTYFLDTEDQFDPDLWYRGHSLARLVRMSRFLNSKIPEGQKTLKMLIVFFGPPDPDSIASGMALWKLFSNQVHATFASTAKVKRFENRAILSYLKLQVLDIHQIHVSDYHVIACVDAQPSFFKQAGFDIPFDICIDHHPEAEDNPNIPFLDIRKHHGACSTILAHYYFYSKKNLPKSLATALLMGLKTDTANFSRSFYPPDIHILNFLYKKADQEVLRKVEFSQVPRRAIKYFKRAFNRHCFESPIFFCHLGRVSYPDIGAILAENFLKIQKAHISAVSCVWKEQVIVYVRSLRKQHPAGEIAGNIFLGVGIGGGHDEMGRAECLLSKLPFPQNAIEKNIFALLKNQITHKRIVPSPALLSHTSLPAIEP